MEAFVAGPAHMAQPMCELLIATVDAIVYHRHFSLSYFSFHFCSSPQRFCALLVHQNFCQEAKCLGFALSGFNVTLPTQPHKLSSYPHSSAVHWQDRRFRSDSSLRRPVPATPVPRRGDGEVVQLTLRQHLLSVPSGERGVPECWWHLWRVWGWGTRASGEGAAGRRPSRAESPTQRVALRGMMEERRAGVAPARHITSYQLH